MMKLICLTTSLFAVIVVVAMVTAIDAGPSRKRSVKEHKSRSAHARREEDREPLADLAFLEFNKTQNPGPPPSPERLYELKSKLLTKLFNQTHLSLIEPLTPVKISFGLSIKSLQYDEKTGIGRAVVWEAMKWIDKRLSWSSDEYDGVESIRIAQYLIWTPDLTLYNSVTAYTERSWDNAVVLADGTVIWIPRAVYQTFCSANEEGVTCPFKIGSWTFDESQVLLEHSDFNLSNPSDKPSIDLSEYESNCGAVPISSSVSVNSIRYECCENPWASYEAEITFTPRGQN